jgi:signal transduction histidine kinase
VTRRLVLAMALLVAIVAVALAVPLATVAANDRRLAFITGLEVDTLTTAATMSAQVEADWQQTAEETAQRTGARVVVVDPTGTLIADSDDTSLDRAFDRPEIAAALAGSLTADVRASTTLGEDLRYVAAPVVKDDDVAAAVRLSLPESIVTDEVQETQLWLAVFVLTVVIGASLVAWLLARSISSPLRRVADVAEALPDDLDLRVDEDHGPPEVRSVAVALNSTAARLSGILRRTERVAADASHHLRTPLTGVRLRLEAIEDTSDQEEVRADARAATAEVDRLTHRIEQVLALARTDAGSTVVEPHDASAVVRDRLDAASGMFVERDIELTASIEPGISAAASSGTIARVIDELLGNALQYATSRVHVGLRESDGSALLTVSDDGRGVPADEYEAVFERFRRGSTSVPGGSGLGLALVRESVRALGGDADAVESPWGGLTVRVRFPQAGSSRPGPQAGSSLPMPE